MSDSTFPDLMNALGEAAEISDLTIEDDRYACLSVDDNFALHIRFEEGSNEVFVFSSLGEITAESETEICRLLLEANYLWQHTGGATLSVYWPEREAVLAHSQSMDLLDPARFCEWINRFLDNATTWRDQLAAANERKAAPAEESLPDPGMEGFDTGALRI